MKIIYNRQDETGNLLSYSECILLFGDGTSSFWKLGASVTFRGALSTRSVLAVTQSVVHRARAAKINHGTGTILELDYISHAVPRFAHTVRHVGGHWIVERRPQVSGD